MTVARGEIRIRTGAADPRARYGTQADAAIVDHVIGRVHLIFYVSDQAAATAFWQAVLDCPPALDVPGMTEFALGAHVVLGLMPETGIRSLLGSSLPDPAAAHGIPRAELYLAVDDAAAYDAAATGRSLRPARRRPARENGKTQNSDPARGGRGHRS